MKSFAIKVNSNRVEKELIKELEQINLNDFYLSSRRFKNFENVIVHYSGKEVITFYSLVSDAIASVIQKEYDNYFINKIIEKNYCYIFQEEQETIKRIAKKILLASKENENIGKEILKNIIFDYLINNKKMILEGFVKFRIKEYLDTLDYIVELAVTSYLNIII